MKAEFDNVHTAEVVAFCEGDFGNDGDVDGSDLAIFAADFGRTDCNDDCKGDFNFDGDVDGSDLAVFAADFGRTDCYKIQRHEGLMAYYPFNGNANDESGNENHGAVNGATLTTDRFTKEDSAYSFDGIDDNINPNVAERFGPKSLRSLYIRPSRNDYPFSRPHRMFNTLSSLKMVNRPLLTQSIPF